MEYIKEKNLKKKFMARIQSLVNDFSAIFKQYFLTNTPRTNNKQKKTPEGDCKNIFGFFLHIPCNRVKIRWYTENQVHRTPQSG